MKYLVLKPRGDSSKAKEYVEFEKSKLNNSKAFVQQQIGVNPIKRVVGDYIFWTSNPEKELSDEYGNIVNVLVNYEETDLKPNLIINEFHIAYGNVVVTSNVEVTKDNFAGLTEHDIANIMNAFTKSNISLVEYKGKQCMVDNVSDAILNPNGRVFDVVLEEPVIRDLGEPEDEIVEPRGYSDELYEEPTVLNDIDDSMAKQLEDEELQERLKEL